MASVFMTSDDATFPFTWITKVLEVLEAKSSTAGTAVDQNECLNAEFNIMNCTL